MKIEQDKKEKLVFALYLINHETLKPTEEYTKFNIYRLEQEFPSLVQKQAQNHDLGTKIKGTTNNVLPIPPLLN